jgi:hypothetical protein
MIDVDVSKAYQRSHGDGLPKRGRQRSMFELSDATDREAVDNVCRKLVELMQAFENLKAAIRACGDCVRFSVPTPRGRMDPMGLAVVIAACVDAASGARDVYLDAEDGDAQMEIEDTLVRALHDAYDTSAYVRRACRRLRRPAA